MDSFRGNDDVWQVIIEDNAFFSGQLLRARWELAETSGERAFPERP